MASFTTLLTEIHLKIAYHAMQIRALPQLSFVSDYWRDLCRQTYDKKCSKKTRWNHGDKYLFKQKDLMKSWDARDPDVTPKWRYRPCHAQGWMIWHCDDDDTSDSEVLGEEDDFF